MPTRIQLRRTKGWRMPPNTVKVDRSTRWGNPFVAHGDGRPMEAWVAVRCFRDLLATTSSWWPRYKRTGRDPPTRVAEIREQLKGKNLACWCPLDQPCHADVLLEIANETERP